MVDSLTKPLANHHRKITDKCQSCLVNSLMYFLVGVLFLFKSFSRKGFVFDFGRPVSIYRILKHGSASEKEQKRESESVYLCWMEYNGLKRSLEALMEC